ncbi:MAG TPA: hypothetical protein VFM34_01355 [Moraxellaceae bacterium]|nr:hypothetical protein [Moraxellaceae bacterium]
MRSLLVLGLAAALAGCVGNGDTKEAPAVPAADSPNAFLTFPNTQAPLGAGSYSIQVSALTGTVADTFHLVITFDDGSTRSVDGSWTAGGTTTLADPLVLARAGGVRIVATSGSGQAVHIVLSRNGSVVADAAGTLNLPLSVISSTQYAKAYYDAVDPQVERDTLEKWKSRNGFYDGNPYNTVTHVVFRDALDLGYGRDMTVLYNSVTGRTAFMVHNYVVSLQPGASSNYGPLNVDAAIAQDPRFFIGTNVIEFSPANEDNPADVNGAMMINKFFIFDKNGNRITEADLDGRGIKPVPGTCWTCHGGETLPLTPAGKFQPMSVRSPKFNILGVADFEYSLQDGYHRDQEEDRLRLLNSYVKGSYDTIASRDINNSATGRGKWSADYAQELVNGRYGSVFTSGTYQDGFVPAGWQNGPGQENAELLFTRVVGPHCTGCHSLQGRAATGTDYAGNLGNGINFSSYTKFMAYRTRIIDYVYKRGIMPLSLRNFESFWEYPDGAPSILASALADPSLFDSSTGKVIPPGRPVARPGADRTVRGPTVQLDGNASYFADSYHWAITSPVASTATLSNPDTARAVLNAPAAGTYVVTLTVTNSRGSHSASETLTVNGAAADQTALTFANDIRPILSNNGCTGCHVDGGIAGIPVYWDDNIDSDGNKLYQRILARVNLANPEDSRLLKKPTSELHGGGVVIDTTTPQGQADYNTLVNWIREGAACGTNPSGLDVGCLQ